MLWLVYFESANYCGYGEHVVVEASSAEAAEDAAQAYADAHYQEEDFEQYADEHGEYEAHELGSWATILTVVEFNEAHPSWEFYINPTQKQFYPTI